MPSITFRRKVGRSHGFRNAAWLALAITISIFGFNISSFETVVALSTTKPPSTKTPSEASLATVPNPIEESPKTNDSARFSVPQTNLISQKERAEILNEQLRRELSELGDEIGDSDRFHADEIVKAALASTKTPFNEYDPRFGRPALRTYRSFLVSDRHTTNRLLLEGLATKTAKQIRNMLKQTFHRENGIVSPPKHRRYSPQDMKQNTRLRVANSIAKGERRARERNQRTLRELCSGCSRPFSLCICGVLNQWKNQTTPAERTMTHTKIVVLQHPNEFRKKHTSTVPLLKPVLGEGNVRIKVGYEFTMKDIVPPGHADGDPEERPIMLFPGPDAIDLDEYVANRQLSSGNSANCNPNENQKQHTLVVIDGTWSEAKRIIRKSPEVLDGCRMVQFAFSDDLDDDQSEQAVQSIIDDTTLVQPSDSEKTMRSRSIYHAMRKEPEEHCLSTLEACGEALRILEGSEKGPKLQDALKAVLTEHVKLHLNNARDASQYRSKRDTLSREIKRKRSKEIEESIFGKDELGDNSSGSDSRAISSSQIENPSREYKGASQGVQPTTIADTPIRLMKVDDNSSVRIRRLTHEDIPVIDSWWENGGKAKSVMAITRSIDADYALDVGASLGIVDDTDETGTKLSACILRYESGPLGILYVSKEHRGKGYGTALLKEATRMVSKKRNPSLECTALIMAGNAASERVFEKVGWALENPNAKKRSGRRRAKRKWIYPPSVAEGDDAPVEAAE